MRLRDVFCILYLVYMLPLILTPSMLSPGLLDFLFTDWGWNVEHYCVGMFILTPIMACIMFYDWWDDRKSLSSKK